MPKIVDDVAKVADPGPIGIDGWNDAFDRQPPYAAKIGKEHNA